MEYKLKKKIQSGEIVVGGFLNFYSPDIVEMLANANCDYFVLDNEHGCFSSNEMVSMIRTADSVGLSTIVRVDYNDSAIQKALDMGAEGVQIPKVNTKEDALIAVDRARYPLAGNRGVGFSARSARVSSVKGVDYLKYSNDNILVIVQIETPEAVENMDEILSVPGVDIAFLGKMDLSTAVGTPRVTDSAPMIELTEKFFNIAQKHNAICGYIYDGTDFASVKKQNARYISLPVSINPNIANLVKNRNEFFAK